MNLSYELNVNLPAIDQALSRRMRSMLEELGVGHALPVTLEVQVAILDQLQPGRATPYITVQSQLMRAGTEVACGFLPAWLLTITTGMAETAAANVARGAFFLADETGPYSPLFAADLEMHLQDLWAAEQQDVLADLTYLTTDQLDGLRAIEPSLRLEAARRNIPGIQDHWDSLLVSAHREVRLNGR